jgi:hypothetical protein
LCLDRPLRDVADAIDRTDGGTSEFLNDERHGLPCLRPLLEYVNRAPRSSSVSG